MSKITIKNSLPLVMKLLGRIKDVAVHWRDALPEEEPDPIWDHEIYETEPIQFRLGELPYIKELIKDDIQKRAEIDDNTNPTLCMEQIMKLLRRLQDTLFVMDSACEDNLKITSCPVTFAQDEIDYLCDLIQEHIVRSGAFV